MRILRQVSFPAKRSEGLERVRIEGEGIGRREV